MTGSNMTAKSTRVSRDLLQKQLQDAYDAALDCSRQARYFHAAHLDEFPAEFPGRLDLASDRVGGLVANAHHFHSGKNPITNKHEPLLAGRVTLCAPGQDNERAARTE